MLKFSNMPATICYSKCLRLFVKNKSGSSKRNEVAKQWMKEQKRMFGPLLETREKRKNKLALKQSDANVTSETNINDNNDKFKNLNDSSELLWTVKKSASRRLKIIKVTGKENELNALSCDESESGKINISDKKNICVIALKNQSKLNNTTEQLNNSVESNIDADLSSNSTNSDAKSENSHVESKIDADLSSSSTNSDAKSKNSQVYDIIKFPIFNTRKKSQDNWNTSEIITQPLMESKNFSLPGVTRILSETMSDEAKLMLENWKKKMTLKLGVEGFQTYSQALLDDSKIMHTFIGDILMKKRAVVPDHLKSTYSSIKLILKDITDVRLIESHVVHPTLGYRGIVDCVACYRGNLCLIDWKKSEKIKTWNTIYDSPLQLSAYIGALNTDPNYPFKVKTGLLAIAYDQGQPPSVFEFTSKKLEFYWREWLKRVEKYHSTKFS